MLESFRRQSGDKWSHLVFYRAQRNPLHSAEFMLLRSGARRPVARPSRRRWMLRRQRTARTTHPAGSRVATFASWLPLLAAGAIIAPAANPAATTLSQNS